MGISIEPPGPADPVTPSQSLFAFGSVTAPGALANIASIAALPAGLYAVDIYLSLSGTLTAAELNNMQLRIEGVTVTTLPVDNVAETTAVSPAIHCVAKIVAGAITVRAIAAGGVAAVYTCLIVASQIG